MGRALINIRRTSDPPFINMRALPGIIVSNSRYFVNGDIQMKGGD